MSYIHLLESLRAGPRTWLITGVAGFIGSNLLETLLSLDQYVVGLDNFATGHPRNLDEVRSLVTPAQWDRFHFIEGDIRSLDDCREACAGVEFVLHQAALGSVPRSLDDPIASNATNIDGFLNMLVAARDAEARSLPTPPAAPPTATTPPYPRSKTSSASRSRPTLSPSTSTSSTPTSSRAPTASAPSACATSTSSASARTPTAPTPRSSPNGPPR